MTGTALILGGGGVTGIAWELGMLAGLAEAGVDLPAADLIVGTSAGSVVGAQITSGADLEDLYATQLADSDGDTAARMGRAAMLRWGWTLLRSGDPQRTRVRIGRLAIDARTMPEAERRAELATRLAVRDWPSRRLLITAVDAESGELAPLERERGVSLLDAVGASCAVPGVWPPVTVDGRRLIDGGVRSPTNADLAADCDRVVVVAPVSRGLRTVTSAFRQAQRLRASGRAVTVISPDEPARRAIGRNVLDPARRPAAARAGRAQAAAVLDEVAAVWSSRWPSRGVRRAC